MKTVSECGFLDRENGCRVEMTELARLPRYHRQKIPGDYLDAMGHMNVRWYMALFDAASWQFFAAHGIDEAYIRNRQLGGFALKHHIQYNWQKYSRTSRLPSGRDCWEDPRGGSI